MKLVSTLLLCAFSGLAGEAAHATTIDVSFPYSDQGSVLFTSWATANEGPGNSLAGTTGNQGGPTFAYNDGNFDGIGAGYTLMLPLSSPALGNDSSVNALLNTIYGALGTINGVVTFTNSAGGSESYDLIGGDTIRDYYNNQSNGGVGFANTLGPNMGATPGTGTVTASNWYSTYDEVNDPTNPGERLDEQTFDLPASWAGTTLTGITIADNPGAGNNTQITLSALQIVDSGTIPVSTTPEPSSVALLGTGLAAVAGAARRKFRRS